MLSPKMRPFYICTRLYEGKMSNACKVSAFLLNKYKNTVFPTNVHFSGIRNGSLGFQGSSWALSMLLTLQKGLNKLTYMEEWIAWIPSVCQSIGQPPYISQSMMSAIRNSKIRVLTCLVAKWTLDSSDISPAAFDIVHGSCPQSEGNLEMWGCAEHGTMCANMYHLASETVTHEFKNPSTCLWVLPDNSVLSGHQVL